MKKKKRKKNRYQKKLDKNSLVMRNMARHTMPPPGFSFTDKKNEYNRKGMAERDEEED